jgi:hypothetical protein
MSNILLESPIFEELFGDRLEEARQQTHLDDRKQAVLETLEHKFGVLPKEITDRVASISDVQRLKKLHYAAIDAVTLESFQQHLMVEEI